MKLEKWKCFTLLASVAALAMPFGVAAQENAMQNHKPKHHMYRLIAEIHAPH
jgi:hypothetical protein